MEYYSFKPDTNCFLGSSNVNDSLALKHFKSRFLVCRLVLSSMTQRTWSTFWKMKESSPKGIFSREGLGTYSVMKEGFNLSTFANYIQAMESSTLMASCGKCSERRGCNSWVTPIWRFSRMWHFQSTWMIVFEVSKKPSKVPWLTWRRYSTSLPPSCLDFWHSMWEPPLRTQMRANVPCGRWRSIIRIHFQGPLIMHQALHARDSRIHSGRWPKSFWERSSGSRYQK